MDSYLQFTGSELSHAVGHPGTKGSWVGDGVEGYLCFGPYVNMGPGMFTAGFYMLHVSGFAPIAATMDVRCGAPAEVIAFRQVDRERILQDGPGLIALDFELSESVRALEVRFHVPSSIILEVRRLVIFKRYTLKR